MNIPSAFQLATAGQSKDIDAQTITRLDIPGRILMEVAGAKASAIIQEHVQAGTKALIFCGRGNNAGDALVVARFLSQNSIAVTVVFAEGTGKLSPDARVNFNLLQTLQGESGISNITVYEDLPDADMTDYDFIVDGLLGIGITSEIREPYGRVIDFINASGKTIFALDLPTGLHADNGTVLGNCVRADYTLAFGTQKLGCYLEDGPGHCGRIFYCDLGFPRFLKSGIRRYVMDPDWIDNIAFRKQTPRHKYEAGIVYVIAGSPGLTGAAVMAAESAWAEGLGSVSVFAPRGQLGIYESHLVHQTKFPVGTKDDVYFKSTHLNEILKHLNRRDGTVIIGPGLGREIETTKLVRKLLLDFKGRVVVDADALWALSGDLSVISDSEATIVLTPHPGELKALADSDINNSFNRMITVENFCRRFQVHMLSKGMPNMVGTPDGRCFVTQYDTRIFARTGFGDILTGKIAALWERTGNPGYSSIKALLDGKYRYELHQKQYTTTPEPLDLI
ncbi:MAG: NAD(P)H-hydrate epimerase [Balneolales bacterium]